MRYPQTSWEHIRCKWDFGAYYAHIKSDSLILDSMILGRLENRGLFAIISSHDGKVFFVSYVNSVGSKIYESNLIRAPRCHVHLIRPHLLRPPHQHQPPVGGLVPHHVHHPWELDAGGPHRLRLARQLPRVSQQGPRHARLG
jgi:hypothetical protein